MISLVLIPLFCFYHFYKVDAFKVYGGLDLHLPYEEDYFIKYKIASLRKYKTFNFNENEFTAKEQLNNVKLYLRNLMNKKDTINGIKLHYGSGTHYDVFIKTIDLLAEEEAPAWAINENDVYIFGSLNTLKKVKSDTLVAPMMNCMTGELMARQAYFETKHKKEEEAYQFKITFFKEKWKLISLGYLGLVFLNVFVLVKLNRQQYL
ncbi:hypothetical protein [Flavobacterium procerum]